MSKTETNIANHLKSGRSLTSLQALRLYHTIRLPEYVRRLRHDQGMRIVMTRIQGKDKWWGKYSVK